jgi:predicted Na+-dependent transporter
MRRYSIVLLIVSIAASAQSAVDDVMYSNGKIYVVVAVLVIIFGLLAGYLVRLDKKITALEKKNEA